MSELNLKEEHKKQFIEYYKHLPDEFLPLDVKQSPKALNVGLRPTCNVSVYLPAVSFQDTPPDGWARDAWVEELCNLFPRSHIPRKLYLKAGYSFQPPRFLYGWAMEQASLKTIAEKCGFSRHLRPIDPDKLCEDLTDVLTAKFPQIMEKLDWVFIANVWVNNEKMYPCIALCDSWITGNLKPTPEQIATLRDFFGIGDEGITTLDDNQPMWWLDLMSEQWHYATELEDLEELRPWDLRRNPVRVKGGRVVDGSGTR